MSRPNIILIMTDQQRADTLGAWGYNHMYTPSMDRLTEEGFSFRSAYCPGATCVASRAAIFTGMYAHNTGAYSFDSWGQHPNWIEDLNNSGYYCANIGKMHFEPHNIRGGFHERVIVENPTSKSHDRGGPDDDWGRYLRLNGLKRPNDRHLTDLDWLKKYQGVPWHLDERFHSDVFIGDSALSWIRDYRGEAPFFLQIGFTGPHEPWDPLERHLSHYEGVELPGCVMEKGELDKKPPQHKAHRKMHASTDHESAIDMFLADENDIDHMRRHYYAKISTVDEKVGQIMDALEVCNFLDDSMLIFCSDHGEMLGDHGLAYKWLMYESVVHVPLIIRDSCNPSSAGNSTKDLVSLMDIGPTVLRRAGIEIPSYFEGRSLCHYLDDKQENVSPREWVFAEDNYQIMMRSRRYKMVYYIGQQAGELYDLEVDVNEMENLWDNEEYSVLQSELKGRMLEWLATSNYYNAGYKRGQQKRYSMRWPRSEDYYLHGSVSQPIERGVDL